MTTESAFQKKINEKYTDFIEDMASYVVNMSGMHYQAMPNIKQNWQTIIPYDKKVENAIISHARTFIYIHIGTRSPLMYKEMMTLISKYIAKYVYRVNEPSVDNVNIVAQKIDVRNDDLKMKHARSNAAHLKSTQKEISDACGRNYTGR